MMHRFNLPSLRTLAFVLVCNAACTGALADTDADSAALNETTQVAGRNLRLNGAGISFHLFFKVYAMGLYLLDHQSTTADVLNANGPRRILIALLRDVSGSDFQERIVRSLSNDGPSPEIAGRMLQMAKAIGGQAEVLRKGDTLTLDWIPGTGTVIELNRKRLTEPVPDLAFYNAVLSMWLGDRPADPVLKTRLLGRSSPMRTVSN